MDGAHLKGDFKGTIMHAVAMDGNHQIVPIGYGICKGESTETWVCFLEKLHECIGDVENLNFVTDRAPSISAALGIVFPNALHGLCGFHIFGNIVKNWGENETTKTLFWGLVKSYKRVDFDELWEKCCRKRPAVAAFLSDIPKEQWSRAYYPGIRYDNMTSNNAESMNALSATARKLPIITLLEFFRASVQKWFYLRRLEGGKICNIVHILNLNIKHFLIVLQRNG